MYLALHKELEEYRAIKAVAKSNVRYEMFRKEALLLKELRHPGIPVVYDIEEDKEYSYLVEEYLQGESLEVLVNRQGPLAVSSILQYMIQICGVVDYLHSAGSKPILHLDLQPKNLLICHETIKLIDFGQAAELTEANQASQRFGTIGFAAPEQYDCSQGLDERTDIYAIGGLFFYLTTGMYPEQGASSAMLSTRMWNREAGRILAACLEPEKKDRYPSVRCLKEELEHLLKRPVSSLVIAVYGLEPGVGATHISLALCSYLWKKGIPNLYEECHPSSHIRKLLEHQKKEMDSFGIFRAFGCMLKPCYGKQVRFFPHNYPIVIQDYGVWKGGPDPFSKESEGLYLLVAGGKWWNQPFPDDLPEQQTKKMAVLYNFSHGKIALAMPKNQEKGRFLKVPLFANPFCPDQAAREWLNVLWEVIEDIGLKKEGRIGGKLDQGKRWKGGEIIQRWRKRRKP